MARDRVPANVRTRILGMLALADDVRTPHHEAATARRAAIRELARYGATELTARRWRTKQRANRRTFAFPGWQSPWEVALAAALAERYRVKVEANQAGVVLRGSNVGAPAACVTLLHAAIRRHLDAQGGERGHVYDIRTASVTAMGGPRVLSFLAPQAVSDGFGLWLVEELVCALPLAAVVRRALWEAEEMARESPPSPAPAAPPTPEPTDASSSPPHDPRPPPPPAPRPPPPPAPTPADAAAAHRAGVAWVAAFTRRMEAAKNARACMEPAEGARAMIARAVDDLQESVRAVRDAVEDPDGDPPEEEGSGEAQEAEPVLQVRGYLSVSADP